VSHDLKTPLVTIKGFLGLLSKDLDTNDMGRAVQLTWKKLTVLQIRWACC